jgi:hypothetical protein
MDENVFSPDPNHSQPDGCGLDRSSEIIKSPWPPDGVNRVLKALNKIGEEWADADAQAARRATVPQVCGGTAAPADAPPPAGPVADPSLGQVPAGHALQAQRLGMRIIHRLRVCKATNLARPTRVKAARPKRASVKPIARKRAAARPRTRRARTAHGARKAADSGGDGPRPKAKWIWYGGGGFMYRVEIQGENAEHMSGARVVVTGNGKRTPVILVKLVRYYPGSKGTPPSAIYTHRKVQTAPDPHAPPREWERLDADGLPIRRGRVFRDGRWSLPRSQMIDHDLPRYDFLFLSVELCRCDKCRNARVAKRSKRRLAS